MQVLERPQQRERNFVGKSEPFAPVRATTLTALSQREGTGYSREFMRESVMSWAARKWPELLIGRDASGLSFEAHSCAASVQVTCASDEEYVWSFKGTHADNVAGRIWETCVLVLGGRDHDLLTVRTGYVGDPNVAVPCVQPRFLFSLIEHLPFEDGGYPLSTLPRQVSGVAAFDNFRDHLLSRRRTLPILAVAQSEGGEPRQPNPDFLARALCGLVHVVSLGAMGVACLENWLGPRMAVSAGEARLFMPGLQTDVDAGRHPAFTDLRTSHSQASDVEAAAQTAIHAWSTSTSRRADFEAHWTRAVAA
jgi:hypothetical protein